MTTEFATNFPIPSSTNVFQCLWKLTRVMKAAGWTYKASSDGSHTKDTSGTAANDFWGGNSNPLLDAYPPTGSGPSSNGTFSDSSAGWWVGSGPQTLKIPLNANPTGTFLRGENITQATTGATGELLGYTWDGYGLSGWAAVLPRTGTFNMTTANTVTGSISGATFAPLSGGTMITYNREVMFYKDTTTLNTTIYYICADASAENAQLFSVLATQTGCTQTVGPAQGGTNNGFPSKGITIRGTGASTTTQPTFALSAGFQTNAQIACVNATPSAGVSADGSFYVVLSNSTTSNTACGLVFTRVDDSEPGDCDPYVFLTSGNSSSLTSWVSTSTTGTLNAAYTFFPNNLLGLLQGTPPAYFFGYQSRGNGSLDVVSAYMATYMASQSSAGGTELISALNSAGLSNPIRTVNSPATTRPLVLEPMSIFTTGATGVSVNNIAQYKGRARWLMWSAVGNTYDTFQSKTLLAVSVGSIAVNTGGAGLCIIVGPYDGITTPIQ